MNVVLDDLTAGWLEWEHEHIVGAGRGRRFLPDQWVPLPELLMVECPTCEGYGTIGRDLCDVCKGHKRTPLPEGVYDIGTERYERTSDGIELTDGFVPLALGVHLRQVEWEKVVRCTCDEEAEFTGIDQPHPDHIKTVSQENLYLSADLYDRLAVSVDGGPPAGVLNVKVER